MPKPVRQRRVNIQRLLRRENLFFGRHMIERAHIVHPVGELDENHAHVLAHGEDHLAEIFRLLLLVAAIVGATQLGDAVDQGGDLAAEQALISSNVVRVSSTVSCSKAADDARHVELQIGDDIGDRYGMNQIRLTGQTFLPVVDFGGEIVGFADQIDIRGGKVSLDLFNQIVKFDFFAHDCSAAHWREAV